MPQLPNWPDSQNKPQEAPKALGLGLGLGGSAVSAAMGFGMGMLNDWRQRQQQEKLNQMQLDQHRQIGGINNELAFDYWKKTGPQAQKEQLKAAGLNPALMYGMGGATGGSTAPGTSSQASQAPQGGGEIMAQMQYGLQLEALKANVELMKSQANKNNVEAEKTAGVDTKLASQQAAHLEVMIQGMEVSNQTATQLQSTVVRMAENQLDQAIEKLKQEQLQTKFDQATLNTRIAEEAANLAYTGALTSAAKQGNKESESRIKVNEQQIKNLVNEIMVANGELQVKQGQLTETQRNNAHYRTNANLTELEKLGGEMLKSITQGLLNKIPGMPTQTTSQTWSEQKGYTETITKHK